MLSSAVVVFREVLESALIVGLLLAATRGIPHRGRWIALGVVLGSLGAAALAGVAGLVSDLFQGNGQELLNAAILFAAVLLLAWHNIWMSQHGQQLAQDARRLGQSVLNGDRTVRVLAVVAAFTLLREGSELALFLYGISLGSDHDTRFMGLGCLLGGALGLGCGALLYLSLVRIPLRHLFRITSWLILFLTAGLAAQGAALLSSANLLPSLGQSLWDTSSWVSEQSLLGQILHAMLGYNARPEGIQLLFYVLTLSIVALAMRRAARVRR